MATLDEQQFADLQTRQSNQDLQDIIAALRLEGSLTVDGHSAPEDEDVVAALEAQLASSRLFDDVPENPSGPSEEELAGNLEAAVAAGEVEEEAPAPKSSKKAAAAEEA